MQLHESQWYLHFMPGSIAEICDDSVFLGKQKETLDCFFSGNISRLLESSLVTKKRLIKLFTVRPSCLQTLSKEGAFQHCPSVLRL